MTSGPLQGTSGKDVIAAHDAPALPTSSLTQCLNCGATLAGIYCAACGQKHDPHIHSVGHFVSEATESITHADSRLWRTLGALLRKPGYLTKEFFAGRRARYMPPVRLYLVLSVVFFLIAGNLPEGDNFVKIDDQDLADAPAAAATPKPAATGKPTSAAAPKGKTYDIEDPAKSKRFCEKLNYGGPWRETVEPRLRAGCSKAVADKGHALSEALLHNLPRALFVLLPLIAGFMWLMYWVPRRHYVEHLLLLVHNHAFVFLAFGIAMVTRRLPWEWPANVLVLTLMCYMPWYFYKSLRVYYAQGRWLTRSKFLLLSLVYLIVALLTLAITAIVSVVTL